MRFSVFSLTTLISNTWPIGTLPHQLLESALSSFFSETFKVLARGLMLACMSNPLRRSACGAFDCGSLLPLSSPRACSRDFEPAPFSPVPGGVQLQPASWLMRKRQQAAALESSARAATLGAASTTELSRRASTSSRDNRARIWAVGAGCWITEPSWVAGRLSKTRHAVRHFTHATILR